MTSGGPRLPASRTETELPVWDGLGTSMLPFVLPRSRLHLRHFEERPAKVQVGDIVCYLGEGGALIAHRVVGRTAEAGRRALLIAGDAAGVPEEVEERAVFAVVTRVEHRLLSYDTGGAIGRRLAGMAVSRSLAMRGALLSARAALAAYSVIPPRGLGGLLRRWLRGGKADTTAP